MSEFQPPPNGTKLVCGCVWGSETEFCEIAKDLIDQWKRAYRAYDSVDSTANGLATMFAQDAVQAHVRKNVPADPVLVSTVSG